MQADGRLIQHIHDAHQAGTDLGRQTDTLRLAAGQGLRRTGQCQIIQTDVIEESKPGTNLLDHLAGDLRGGALKFKTVDPCETTFGRHVAHVRDGFPSHGDGEHFGAEPPAMACLAWHFAHIRFVILLHLVGIGLIMSTHQRADHAFESRRIFADTSPPVAI